MENNELNDRENNEEEYVLEEIDIAIADAMQEAKNKDSDSDGDEISDSDTDDEEIRIFRNIPGPVCSFSPT